MAGITYRSTLKKAIATLQEKQQARKEADQALEQEASLSLKLITPSTTASNSWTGGSRTLSLQTDKGTATSLSDEEASDRTHKLYSLVRDHTETFLPLRPEIFFKENYPIQGHENIDDFIQKISSTGWKPPTVSYKNISDKDLKHRIDIAEDGSFCVTTHFEGGFAINFGKKLEKCLKGFSQALLQFNENIKYILSKNNKRAYELLLLNHRGYFGYTLYQFFRNFLSSQPLSPLEFQQKISSELAEMIDKKLNPGRHLRFDNQRTGEPLTLQKTCNESVSVFFKKFIHSLYDTFEYLDTALYLSQDTLLITSFHKVWAYILFEMIERQVIKTKADCFQKKTTPILSLDLTKSLPKLLSLESASGDFPQPQRFVRFDNFPTEDMWTVFIRVAQKCPQVEVFYEGQALQVLNSKNFVTEFFLEKPGTEDTTDTVKNTTQDIDWFELHPKFFLNGEEVPEDHIKKMNQKGVLEWNGKLYLVEDKNLPSIQYLEKFWNKIRTGTQQKKTNKLIEAIYPLPKNQTLELLWLRTQGVPIHGNQEWEKICQFYDTLHHDRRTLTLPDTLKADLKPYQHIGVQWLDDLYQLGLGGILADDMGLGKTLQSLAFLENLRTQNKMGQTLVLVPATLIYNWQSEARRFTPEIPLHIFNSKSRTANHEFLLNHPQCLVICSYGLFVEHGSFFKQYNWNIHLYDEAQNLKNIIAKRTSMCREIPARFKLCLTGTPLENHLGEFFSLVDLTVPDSLGGYDQFRKIYLNPPEVPYDQILQLKQKTKPLVLRRTKSEILKELPEKVETTIELPFEEKQKKIYRDIALSWNERVKDSLETQGEAKSQLLMLTALLRLRQTCSDPSALPKVKYTPVPPKVETLTESLLEITESGESALVFTQFLATFKRIHSELKSKNIPVFCIEGSTSTTERKKNLEAFNDHSQGAVMLMTLKSGGVGLNLVKASYVFHIEPWWNPAVENQASDRAHRIGQTRKVQIYRYIMKDSVEEKIEVLKTRKNQRFQALFGSAGGDADFYNLETNTPHSTSSKLSREDFEFLVKPTSPHPDESLGE